MLSKIYKDLYDYLYTNKSSNDDPRLNHIGWNSSFNGNPYTTEEMIEWRNDTVNQIKKFKHCRIMEVACGTGMLLFSLLKDCNYYFGIDLSEKGIEYISNNLNEDEKEKTKLEVSNATELNKFRDNDFDIAIMNSAAQYMGPADEFTNIIRMIVDKIKLGGIIFLGDLKSESLRHMFYKHIETANGKNKEEIEELALKRENKDFEFYISKEYMKTLKKEIPRIKNIDIQLKCGFSKTEMNMYRYNAVIYLDDYKDIERESFDISFYNSENIESLFKENRNNFRLNNITNKHLSDVKENIFYENISSKNCYYPAELFLLAEKYGYDSFAISESDNLEEFDFICDKRKI